MKRFMILFSVAEKNPIGATPNFDNSASQPATNSNIAPSISNGSTKLLDQVK